MLVDLAQYIMAEKSAMKIASSMHVRFDTTKWPIGSPTAQTASPQKRKPAHRLRVPIPFLRLWHWLQRITDRIVNMAPVIRGSK